VASENTLQRGEFILLSSSSSIADAADVLVPEQIGQVH
jgi:hypothetical protein